MFNNFLRCNPMRNEFLGLIIRTIIGLVIRLVISHAKAQNRMKFMAHTD